MSLNRRDFLKSFAAFAASLAGTDIFAAGKDLKEIPAYYDAYLAERIAAINRNRMEGGCDAGFFFITDLHAISNRRNSGLLIARLVKETGIRRVICGGDIPVAFGTPDDLRKIVDELWPQHWREPIQNAGATLYQVKGNHDFHITAPDKRAKHIGLQYSAEETAKILRLCNGNAAAVTDAENPTACYCYCDDAAERIRYVFADTSDAPCQRQEKVGVEGGHIQMSPRQLKWLATQAFGTVPAGYSVVAVQHVPLAPAVFSAGIGPTLMAFRELMEAYQARRSCVIAGETYDFAKRAGGDILVNLTGHHHSDRQSWYNGILHISESCDAAYLDSLRRTPFSGKLPKKSAGTVYEQTFDCIQLNVKKGLLNVTRLGGGQDRSYHLKPVRVAAGKAVKVSPEIVREPVSWVSIDCDWAKTDHKASTPETYWKFRHKHGKVASDGTFAAGTPGPALAAALDKDLRKEFFGIDVERAEPAEEAQTSPVDPKPTRKQDK